MYSSYADTAAVAALRSPIVHTVEAKRYKYKLPKYEHECCLQPRCRAQLLEISEGSFLQVPYLKKKNVHQRTK